jgi:hypothetical protein
MVLAEKNRLLQMSDLYFKAIQEQWPNIRALYMTYGSEKPIILYDINEPKNICLSIQGIQSRTEQNIPSLIGTRLQVCFYARRHGCFCQR